MKLRVFLYKPGKSLLNTLPQYIDSLGHDVAVIDFPQTCLQYHTPEKRCSIRQVCADAIIVGQDSSPAEGLAMLEKRASAGCQGVVHNAIIHNSLSDADRSRASAIGCRCFEEPLQLEVLSGWLNEIQQKIDQERELSSFTVGSHVA